MAWEYALFAIPGSYICLSVVFLRFPTLLHKKKPHFFDAKHISHRGGAGERLENTMAAFKHAYHDCGTQMLEVDLQYTADKQVVVAHDNNLKRLCGVDLNISDLKFEELPPILRSLPLQFDSRAMCHDETNDRKFVSLRALFKQFPKLPINIDVKGFKQPLADEVRSMIHEFDRVDITPWGNFLHSTTQALYKTDKRIPILFSLRSVASTVFLFYTGLLPFVPINERFFEMVLPSPLLREDFGFKIKAVLRIIDWLTMSPVFFRHLQRRGIKVYLWVVNEDKDFERAFMQLDVDGVMTDYPDRLRKFLDRNEL